MKLTKNQKMLLGAAALVGVAVFLYNRNKKANATSGNGGNEEETSSFGGRRMIGGTRLKGGIAGGNDERVLCTNPTSRVRRGNPKDPCCTGTIEDCDLRGGLANTQKKAIIGR
jgi:hypothetical protein